MAEECASIVLVGRDEARLQKLRSEVAAYAPRVMVSVSTSVADALHDADLILAVSSATDALVQPQHLKAGAVVCDVARPRDVSVQVQRERDDVLVIEGGVVAVPGDVNFNFNFGFPDKTAYACMSETMLMALEGTYEPFTLGRDISVEQVKRIGQIAAQHNFKLAGFRSFERAVSDEHIATVRSAAKKRVAAVVSNPSVAQA
jgi:predicted amino acid dehydrogenase